ncbi:tRNA 2-selenouridine(34) synthase MnmH [Fluviibacterium sp. DFM31]|uniref:tRNA 2-selenouridine(34) synthase MnmH n=1 Tax=Meridianimarinicoccus marinus TaxID=3231483 RepID=A0ABV3L144_9RHOB
MAFLLTDLRDLPRAGFDDLIDARAPSEFAEDHLPGALSLPVLSDEERARVGTMYVQQSRFGARKMGAALVIRNIAAHLEGPLANREGGWRPLVYCWRGGQRSGTFGWLLKEIGWRAETLEGGYRSYRRLVVRALYDQPIAPPLVMLDGMTCTAKTEVLRLLAQAGWQVLDLEGLARHRGSIFGGRADPQPGQKAFEGAIAQALSGFDPARPVVVEAESSKVGNLIVPPQVWSAMCAAPRVRLAAPLAARAEFFLAAYADLLADPVRFSATIGKLRRLHGAAQVAAWQGQVAEGAFGEVAAGLMAQHYDPRYRRSSARHDPAVTAGVDLEALTPEALTDALPRIAAALEKAVTGPRG